MLRLTSLVLGFIAVVFTTSLQAQSPPPNIVVIFIDDMGYADINPFGATEYQTPNLNRMASEGRKFTDFVVSSAVCSASRSALMTGCYHRRVGISGALGPKSNIGIAERETTLAELCKSKGYATAAFGKWHLGHDPKFLPTNHGFDEFYGIPYSNDMWPLHPASVAQREKDPNAKIAWPALPMIEATVDGGVTIVNDDIQPADQEQMTKQFTERAVGFIKDHVDTPFFLYLPHPMVHVPLYASEEFRGKSGAGKFGDVVMEVDWSVGEILNAIEDIGVERNTLVVFTSDNGPWLSYGTDSGKATPLREGKGTMFEGGYREPTIMWWKGKIPAGTTCDELGSTIDLLPTVAALIGADLPKHKIDGKDIRPLMFGEAGAVSPHNAFYGYYGGGQLQTIRNERFKLVFPHKYRTLKGHPGGFGGRPVAYTNVQAELALYDLDNDVSETTNVMDKFPAEVAKLQAAAEEAREDLGDKLTGRSGKGIRPADSLSPDDARLPQNWR
ncbi:sulfatase family protein [Rubripirellula reticaptiva]|uniref:Arylsulfatase n=1 Tax=Rubripirellula reticaptiva TaxID=2528013 RepID=A0A5C6ELL7_9BACT|nr:sulfatase [Rubripirellula reticaptiva]TWU49748.1 Arylsulfatase [Rubripirellula reticaptiva]